ncbi:MAG: error-prone DNA polymerase [Gammaproteobacteria bacterium PRO9]|nr:error-prone DNA polymerase [Gammaproteobacteria bacterium PRO9]
MSAYAELHCISNFTFLRGASHPAELIERAAALGYAALALTDECSVAGIVRAHVAARRHALKLLVGSEFRIVDGLRLVVLAADRDGYAALCDLITRGRRAAAKGSYCLVRNDFESLPAGCLLLWLPPAGRPDPADARWLKARFDGRIWLAVELHADGDAAGRCQRLMDFAAAAGLPPVAAGDVHMHVRGRRAVQDTLTAIRRRLPLAESSVGLHPNGERHLRTRVELASLYPASLLAATVEIADRLHFSLDELRYQYPHELVPAGHTPTSWLKHRTLEGLAQRWPDGVADHVRQLVEHELELIAELRYEAYFLTVDDIVRFARGRGILCQGRGSAANSAVCFCLGITEVDPARMSLLFERFMSRERNEPPDIDVDFEHERREEVIQYIYARYGRERTALTATVISYCPRSAIRDVGAALGLSRAETGAIAGNLQWWDGLKLVPERVREVGLDPDSPLLRRLLSLAGTLIGFPRHLSQHVGGFVMTEEPLYRLVPVENAAMAGRTVIQWDKDDLDEMGFLKVDVLALGMLSAIRRSFALLKAHKGMALTLHDVPAEDPAVYAMIGRGDTMGVFQIESRAQMAMLPRLQPRCYYDLVIEVAIIRPGPIQGDMVHPYLRRRSGEEPVSYPSAAVRGVLERTLGVPIFQEQVMQLAVVAAGFTPGEADQLRRAMAAWRRRGGLAPFEERLIAGMRARDYPEDFARQIFRQICGFGEYGFPESHAASFALLVYVSAWLKHHEPAVFCCALLNSQPMGFYAPAQLVQDVRRHGVAVRPVAVNHSDWDCTLEPDNNRPESSRPENSKWALRLGLRLVTGLREADGLRLVARRGDRPYRDVHDLHARSGLSSSALGLLAAAGALAGIAGDRHQARWAVAGAEPSLPVLPAPWFQEGTPLLRAPTEGQEIGADYQSTGLTLGRHPLALLRQELRRRGIRTANELQAMADATQVRVAGIVTARQRPGSAKGVTFVTLEDESGYVNLIVWPGLAERQRRVLLESRLLGVWGRVQRQRPHQQQGTGAGSVLHVVAGRLEDHSRLLGTLLTRSRDFS